MQAVDQRKTGSTEAADTGTSYRGGKAVNDTTVRVQASDKVIQPLFMVAQIMMGADITS